MSDKGSAPGPGKIATADGPRAQSAMEFMVMHGWAFLIIGIVFVMLYVFGVFRINIGSTSVCSANAGFTCSNIKLDTNYNDFCGGQYGSLGGYSGNGEQNWPSINMTISTVYGPWTWIYVTEVPDGQVINDIVSTGIDTSYKWDFFHWYKSVGYGSLLTSMAPNQQITTSVCISQPFAPANTVGKSSVQGTVWVMYSSLYVTNALAQLGQFTATASR